MHIAQTASIYPMLCVLCRLQQSHSHHQIWLGFYWFWSSVKWVNCVDWNTNAKITWFSTVSVSNFALEKSCHSSFDARCNSTHVLVLLHSNYGYSFRYWMLVEFNFRIRCCCTHVANSQTTGWRQSIDDVTHMCLCRCVRLYEFCNCLSSTILCNAIERQYGKMEIIMRTFWNYLKINADSYSLSKIKTAVTSGERFARVPYSIPPSSNRLE